MRVAIFAKAVGVTGVGALLASVALAQGAPGAAKFSLERLGTQPLKVGQFSLLLPLQAERPAGVRKEPAYRGKPQYAVLKVGNGPKATYVAALDEPAEGEPRVYVDANRNGDLTDDGDGAWAGKTQVGGKTRFGANPYVLRASWGTSDRETGSGQYALLLSRTPGDRELWVRRDSARFGTVTLDGKAHKAVLVENDSDAVFAKPVDTDAQGQPVGAPAKGNNVLLLIDLNDDGQIRSTRELPEQYDVRAPFMLMGKTYEAAVAPDGATVSLAPTTRAAAKLRAVASPEARMALANLLRARAGQAGAPAAARPALLAPGTTAPNFTVEAWGGGNLKLSDLKGKVVVLDFWATWCGPCRASMPHLEQVHQAYKDRGVVVLAVCVSDERAAYMEWVPANLEKFTYRFAFDPAGKDRTKSISKNLFNVSGIPTTYIIDRDDKVVEAVVGYRQGDERVEAALKKAGVD